MLHLVTCFFNSADYQYPLRNYKVFADKLREQGIPLLTVELAFFDRPFVLEGDGIVRLRSQSLLWQKERLLNHAISLLPEQFDKVGWVDADILFENADFASMTEEALDRYDVVQMFEKSYRLNPEQTEFTRKVWSQEGTAHSLLRGGPFDNTTMGFAWAAKRSFLQTVDLYERAVLGGGDYLMLNALFGREQPRYSEAVYQDVMTWTNKALSLTPTVGYVPVNAAHLWHGSIKNRRYFDRHQILTDHNFDPMKDIYCINQVFEWATFKPKLHDAVKNYFLGRQEDSVRAG